MKLAMIWFFIISDTMKSLIASKKVNGALVIISGSLGAVPIKGNLFYHFLNLFYHSENFVII